MRALCYHYGVELHNFAPNVISQAATFVGVCEGYLGIPVNWELWIHLFHAELFTQPTTEQRTCRVVHAGGMSLALRGQFKDDYIPCTMTTNNAGWERGWFYLRNTEPGLPAYTGLVLREKPNSWGHGVSTAQHLRRLDSLLGALKNLATRGLTAAGVLAFLHHRRVVPLMERPLCVYQMTEEADPSRWRCRGCSQPPSSRGMRSPGRETPSTPGCCARIGPRGTSRCSPPARW
jgi:hypothetical protein